MQRILQYWAGCGSLCNSGMASQEVMVLLPPSLCRAPGTVQDSRYFKWPAAGQPTKMPLPASATDPRAVTQHSTKPLASLPTECRPIDRKLVARLHRPAHPDHFDRLSTVRSRHRSDTCHEAAVSTIIPDPPIFLGSTSPKALLRPDRRLLRPWCAQGRSRMRTCASERGFLDEPRFSFVIRLTMDSTR